MGSNMCRRRANGVHATCVVLLVACVAVVRAQGMVQQGNRFPLGVGVGFGGNCTQPEDAGFLRYADGTVEVRVGQA